MTTLPTTIWDMKYRFKDADGVPFDDTVEDTWRRIARALSSLEDDPKHWEDKFYDALEDYKFLPAGRIAAGAGTGRDVTLFNCFVMGTVPDDLGGIFDMLKEAALTMQQGGGIGYDFSTLRPKGSLVRGVAADASGPLTFMDVWDSMCKTIMSAGTRRGAMMATMRCDHPDIEAFIEAKADAARLRMFNLSVLVTDDFMAAVEADEEWPLAHKVPPSHIADRLDDGRWVYATISARTLWDKIMKSTYDYAEPGVIFIDRINQMNNLNYCEDIAATNPCGEQPLPPYGACLLGSINLAKLVQDPFTSKAQINYPELTRTVWAAVRMMDNVNDVSKFPLEEQRIEAQNKRRIGLGVTGLANALAMLKVAYGTIDAASITEEILRVIALESYACSIDLAREKGAFPLYDQEQYMKGEFFKDFPESLMEEMEKYGIRNALLTSIAPTGTISMYAGNVSSGVEPVFAFDYTRKITQRDGSKTEERVVDYAVQKFEELFPGAKLPDYFVSAQTLEPLAHVRMQAAAQKWIDSSISKTINCPEDISFEKFKGVYMEAWDTGCKGCTTYRPNDVTGSVLSVEPEKEEKEEEKVVYLTDPLDRPQGLEGATYKLKWSDSPHAIYLTVNDVVLNGQRRPFEVFINSKNMEHYAWTVALTRMISAVFRRGGDVSFVVEELNAVFDPRGGSWIDGKYVPSMLAAIGGVLEQHMVSIGFIESSEPENSTGLPCPECGQNSVQMTGGCATCTNCGNSKCG